MTSLYLIEPRTRRRAPAAPDPFDDRACSIPPVPPSLRERMSRADWSIFDSADDRAIAPRGRVVRAGLVAMMLAALASLAAVAFVR